MPYKTVTYRQRYWHTIITWRPKKKYAVKYRQRYWHTITRKIKIKEPKNVQITLITAFHTHKQPGLNGWQEASFEIWCRNIVITQAQYNQMTTKDWETFSAELDAKLSQTSDIGWIYALSGTDPSAGAKIAQFWGIETNPTTDPANLETDVTVYRSGTYETMTRTKDKEVKPCKTRLRLTWTGNRLQVS